jgi:hypothetical protein
VTPLLTVVIVLHGLIHLMGFAKAFGYADLPQLTQPISPGMGMLWLAAAILMLATAGALFLWPRGWWAIGAIAVVVSQVAIMASWNDARFGTIANVVILVAIVFGFLAWGPSSLRAQYETDVARGLARMTNPPIVIEADLARLPAPVAGYLRASGVVGQLRVVNMRARMHGRIRGAAGDPWMPFEAEQHNFYDRPARFFYMNASRMFMPIQGYHRFVDREATMLVKLAAIVPVARASGPDMTQAETVTLFNDMCLFAPATLIDPAIGWEPVDARTVRATFTHAGHTIRADLTFNDRDELVDFHSDDRRQAAAAGAPMRAVRWSTPVGDYRRFGAVRLGARGEARWHDPAGTYAYIEITLDDIQFNVSD